MGTQMYNSYSRNAHDVHPTRLLGYAVLPDMLERRTLRAMLTTRSELALSHCDLLS